jgi:hypothetical protein
MAKKKNQGKKHKFKHTSAMASNSVSRTIISDQDIPNTEVSSRQTAPVRKTSLQATTVGRDFSYVSNDLRRVMLFAVCLVGLELVLWFVFGHTAFGPAVYQSIKV